MAHGAWNVSMKVFRIKENRVSRISFNFERVALLATLEKIYDPFVRSSASRPLMDSLLCYKVKRVRRPDWLNETPSHSREHSTHDFDRPLFVGPDERWNFSLNMDCFGVVIKIYDKQ